MSVPLNMEFLIAKTGKKWKKREWKFFAGLNVQ
jgi:hypothetical protein